LNPKPQQSSKESEDSDFGLVSKKKL